MKDPIALPVAEVVAHLRDFNTLVDARSPSEYAEDHLPGALNAPVLDDAERTLVGTLNAERGAFEAKRLGAAIVSRNIGGLIEPRMLRALLRERFTQDITLPGLAMSSRSQRWTALTGCSPSRICGGGCRSNDRSAFHSNSTGLASTPRRSRSSWNVTSTARAR